MWKRRGQSGRRGTYNKRPSRPPVPQCSSRYKARYPEWDLLHEAKTNEAHRVFGAAVGIVPLNLHLYSVGADAGMCRGRDEAKYYGNNEKGMFHSDAASSRSKSFTIFMGE